MRAAVTDRYGGPEVVRVTEVPRPTPGRGEVLVRVVAAAVSSGDARIRAARFPAGFGVPGRLALGVRGPRRPILGGSFSGVVEEVGAGAQGFAVGDEVCGMAGTRLGAHAEYVVASPSRLAAKPGGVSHEEGAGLLFGGTTAWWFLREQGRVGPGASVLVNGASGAVGTNAVQLARHLGATVTGVTSGGNAALVTSLGAARTIDHTAVDLADITERFDVVLDAVGTLSIASGRRLLAPGGVLLLVVPSLWEMIRARGNVRAGTAPERAEAMAELLALVAAGDLRVVIDRVVDLDDIVEAHRRVDTGRKVGNVVVRIAG